MRDGSGLLCLLVSIASEICPMAQQGSNFYRQTVWMSRVWNNTGSSEENNQDIL